MITIWTKVGYALWGIGGAHVADLLRRIFKGKDNAGTLNYFHMFGLLAVGIALLRWRKIV